MIELFQKLDRLDRQKQNLMAEIINLPDPVLYHKSSNRELSVVEKLENLRIIEKSALKSIQRNIELNPNFAECTICADVKMLLTRLLLATKLPMFTRIFETKIEKRPDFDYLIEDWSLVRKSLRQTISTFDVRMSNKMVYEHPVLGMMNMNHVLDFFGAQFTAYEKQVLKQVETVY